MIDYIYFTKNISFRYILVFSGPSRRLFVICAKTGAKLCFPVLMTLFPFLFVLGMTIAATITSNMGYATSTGFGALMMLLVMLLILIMILRHVWSPYQVAIGTNLIMKNSMVAIHNEEQMECKVMLYSIDNDTKSAATLEQLVQ